MENGLDELIVQKLGLRAEPLEIDDWRELLYRIKNPHHEVTVGVVGKYVQHRDAYKSVYEALDHAGIANGARVVVRRIESEEVEQEGAERLLAGVDGILVPGGFGHRGIEGKIDAIRFARTRTIPFFGLCLGMQCAVIEFARNRLGLAGANSTEFDRQTDHPVICLMEEQRSVTDYGATMRLGSYPCELATGSLAARCYGRKLICERHRHRYELNNEYRARLAVAGMAASGVYAERDLVEIIELVDHPWFLAVQFHPEFKSKPTAAHPLFRSFVAAALERREAAKLEAAGTDDG